MKKFFLILASSALLMSCNKEDNYATVTMDLQATLEGSDFSINNNFSDSQGRTIKFELIKFYLSNITFVNTKGDETMIHEIALFELNENGHASIALDVPTGRYSKIKFGIGVPDVLNEADPSNYNETGHPLSVQQNTYWGMNFMYRFVMIDGRYDLEPDQTYDGIFSYHSGHSQSYRNVEYDLDLKFKKNSDYTLSFVIDVDEILEGASGNLDIVNEPSYHGDQNFQHLADLLSDNFAAAIKLK